MAALGVPLILGVERAGRDDKPDLDGPGRLLLHCGEVKACGFKLKTSSHDPSEHVVKEQYRKFKAGGGSVQIKMLTELFFQQPRLLLKLRELLVADLRKSQKLAAVTRSAVRRFREQGSHKHNIIKAEKRNKSKALRDAAKAAKAVAGKLPLAGDEESKA